MRPLHALTGLRFVAAMYVVLFHFFEGGRLPAALARVLGMGYSAVGFFFVLSGFILAYSYVGRKKGSDARTFWIARFARIYPVYALAMLLALPGYVAHVRESGVATGSAVAYGVSSFALLQAWFPPAVSAYNFNIPSWSLSVEALFYLLFPVALPLLARLPSKRLVGTAAAFAALAFALALLATLAFPGSTTRDYGAGVQTAKYLPLIHLPEFLFGVVLGRLFRERSADEASGRGMATLAWVAVGALLAISQIPGLLLLKHSGGLTFVHGALIWALAHERGALARLLARPMLVLFGEASYGIYILHLPVITLFVAALDAVGLGRRIPYAASHLVGFVLIVPVAVLVHRFFELPAREWIRARFTRLNPHPVA